jgi:hypothetical protein
MQERRKDRKEQERRHPQTGKKTPTEGKTRKEDTHGFSEPN